MKIEFDATKNVEYNLEKQKKVLACFIYCPGCASVSSVCVCVCGNGTPFKSFKFYSQIIFTAFRNQVFIGLSERPQKPDATLIVELRLNDSLAKPQLCVYVCECMYLCAAHVVALF